MAEEIERKFLVKGDFRPFSTKKSLVVQGFLSSDPSRTVRVRIRGAKGYLTVKGLGSASGASRFEWETEISVEDARNLLKICEPGIIEKIRHEVAAGKHVFEVDEFLGDNEGLVVAEIELKAEDEAFEKPQWLGEEVTGIEKYYNSMLARHPFKKWD